MKTIKVTEEVHKKLIPLTTQTGSRRTINEIINERISDMPYANLRDISFDDVKGKILVADFYLSEFKPNINDICAEVCICFDNPTDDLWEKIQKSKKLVIDDLWVGDNNYILECENFMADPHIGSESNDVCLVSLFVDDYMKYCTKKENNNVLHNIKS